MALVCDTGSVYALYDAADKHHPAAKRVVEAQVGPLYLPVVLLAEIDLAAHKLSEIRRILGGGWYAPTEGTIIEAKWSSRLITRKGLHHWKEPR
jgi:hypothetical protein